jgi:septum formation protein
MLILASTSPRRRELLTHAGIEFTVQAANIPEDPRPGEAPEALARRLATEKAEAVWKDSPHAYVLGADTIVITSAEGGKAEVLGKPKDPADAVRMLRKLSGQVHEVLTGVCLMLPSGRRDVRHETTRVHMQKITPAEVDFYVAHGEPMDKAGAYAIQGIASRWIDRIEGDYFNVMGLPVALVYRMLREHQAL